MRLIILFVAPAKIAVVEEQIILVDTGGKIIGQAPKLASHHANTPLHLAFSCYVFDEQGRYLLTRRALSKKVWPGWWTVSFCGHLSPGETAVDALRRRADFELGIKKLRDIALILPDYRYKTPPYKGIIENEICPVYVAVLNSEPVPNPDEVEEYEWVVWPKVLKLVENNPGKYSWWMEDEIKLLKKSPEFKQFLAKLIKKRTG